MRSPKPPRVATWLLEHFRSGSGNDCITGDLMEAYERGRSRGWYWKQVLTAIAVSFCQEIMAHPVLALRAIAIGEAGNFLYSYGFVKYVLVPVSKLFLPQYYKLQTNPLALIWWTLWTVVGFATTGWIVARLHRSHRTGMVLAFTASVLVFRLRMLPWMGSLAADTLTNSRFLPYLLTDMQAFILPPLAILFGGLWGASSAIEPRVQEQSSTPN